MLRNFLIDRLRVIVSLPSFSVGRERVRWSSNSRLNRL